MIATSQHNKVLTAYRHRLAGLAGIKGQRNASLLGIANLGILAGLPDCQLEQEVREASGAPPLTVAEIRHAIRTARRDTQPLSDRTLTAPRWMSPKPKPPPLGSGAASFVRRMIGKGAGATFEKLAASSPVKIPTAMRDQTVLFLRTLYSPTEILFCGERFKCGTPGADIDTCGEWARLIGGDKLDAPALVCANPLTGRQGETKEGKESFRCAACVAAYRFALVEFDDLPLSDQCAFWAGVITTRTLPLRSLTYSGGKSLHGLVEIGATDKANWDRLMEILLYATANHAAPKEHQADRACRNPDRLTRLPGASTWDKTKNRDRSQPLLWLSGGNRRTETANPALPSPPMQDKGVNLRCATAG